MRSRAASTGPPCNGFTLEEEKEVVFPSCDTHVSKAMAFIWAVQCCTTVARRQWARDDFFPAGSTPWEAHSFPNGYSGQVCSAHIAGLSAAGFAHPFRVVSVAQISAQHLSGILKYLKSEFKKQRRRELEKFKYSTQINFDIYSVSSFSTLIYVFCHKNFEGDFVLFFFYLTG